MHPPLKLRDKGDVTIDAALIRVILHPPGGTAAERSLLRGHRTPSQWRSQKITTFSKKTHSVTNPSQHPPSNREQTTTGNR